MIMHIDSYKFTRRNTVSTYVATISLFESNLMHIYSLYYTRSSCACVSPSKIINYPCAVKSVQLLRWNIKYVVQSLLWCNTVNKTLLVSR